MDGAKDKRFSPSEPEPNIKFVEFSKFHSIKPKYSRIDNPFESLLHDSDAYYIMAKNNLRFGLAKDPIQQQMKKLKSIKYIFNINEILVLRGRQMHSVHIYTLMTGELFRFEIPGETFFAAHILYDHVICFLLTDRNCYLDIRDHKYAFTPKYPSLDQIYTSYPINEGAWTNLVFESVKNLIVERFRVGDIIPEEEEIIIPLKERTLKAHRFMNYFDFNDEINVKCFALADPESVPDPRPGPHAEIDTITHLSFFYIIHLPDGQDLYIPSLYDLIIFLRRNFYTPLATCTLLCKSDA
ncbi:hypothetical protein DLEV_162 [Diachasmimorpha longicaudata entomopoxvirus]|uniref:Uncharacterized protein n=1 Tax=Diachasmimorpha longicaudata entomopoxvirus TaxID=109981 RepID=A0A7R5WJH0_9POXV|nr:hypothetical protein QKK69_gp162 [Diachasmimorpha longicaudata entomopoxvirus]AKS26453.1 hypothetical protein DLEV_162 [Diachasmimorpha longicaudata entomopoxvirus]